MLAAPKAVRAIVAGAAFVAASAAAGACSDMAGQPPRPGGCGTLRIVETYPAPGAVDVPDDVIVSATFDDFPDPDTINMGTMGVSAGFYGTTGIYSVDLVDRQALFLPTFRLSQNIGYTMTIGRRIRSLSGCTLATPPPADNGKALDAYYISFLTANPGTVPPAPRPVAPAPTFDRVVDLFRRSCTGSACHLAATPPATADAAVTADAAADDDGGDDAGADAGVTDDGTCLDSPAGGLSLCPRDAPASLIGVRALEAVSLVRVSPHDSSRSYIVRKLLGAPPAVGHSTAPTDALSRADLHLLTAWIDAGAPH